MTVNQAGFARARDSCHGREDTEWDVGADVAQVVGVRAGDMQEAHGCSGVRSAALLRRKAFPVRVSASSSSE